MKLIIITTFRWLHGSHEQKSSNYIEIAMNNSLLDVESFESSESSVKFLNLSLPWQPKLGYLPLGLMKTNRTGAILPLTKDVDFNALCCFSIFCLDPLNFVFYSGIERCFCAELQAVIRGREEIHSLAFVAKSFRLAIVLDQLFVLNPSSFTVFCGWWFTAFLCFTKLVVSQLTLVAFRLHCLNDCWEMTLLLRNFHFTARDGRDWFCWGFFSALWGQCWVAKGEQKAPRISNNSFGFLSIH